MGRVVFVTGASGALGPHLLTELLLDEQNEKVLALIRPGPTRAARFQALCATVLQLAQCEGSHHLSIRERLYAVGGDVRCADLALGSDDRHRLELEVDTVVHAAALTRFTARRAELWNVNVDGTARVVEFARRCRRLRAVLLVSTTCVAGTRTGTIPERLDTSQDPFINDYEWSKSVAEQLVAASGVPARIARLSTCVGAQRTGFVHRFGAIHQSIRWLAQGLVPMIPAVDGSRVDLIATDVAARWLARAVACPPDGLDVCHVAAGASAIPVADLVHTAVAHLRQTTSGWSGGQIESPLIVDTPTFKAFERCIRESGDVLFGRVLDSALSFFPALLYPKVYDTARAESLWGGPLPLSDWRSTLRAVIDFGTSCNWRVPAAVRERVHV